MQKIIFYITSIVILICCLISCVQDEKEIFNNFSIERIKELNSKCEYALLDSKNGWVMEYFPNTKIYGGYIIYMNFTKDHVEMSQESDFSKTEKSSYSFKSNNSAVLSFDTYNSILHQYSDPGRDGVGYGGDFEFTIEKVSNDHITFRGIKRGDIIFMNKIPEETTKEQYFESLINVRSILFSLGITPPWHFYSSENNVLNLNNDGYPLHFEAFESTDSSNIQKIASISTISGVHFNPPLVLNGKLYEYFNFSPDKNRLISVEDNSSYIEAGNPLDFFNTTISSSSPNVSSSNRWVIGQNEMSAEIQGIYDRMVASCNALDRTLLISLEYNGKRTSDVFRIVSKKGNSTITAYLDLEKVIQDNAITYTFLGKGDSSGLRFYQEFDGFADFIDILSNTQMKVEPLVPFNYSTLKIQSISNPDVWFNVTYN